MTTSTEQRCEFTTDVVERLQAIADEVCVRYRMSNFDAARQALLQALFNVVAKQRFAHRPPYWIGASAHLRKIVADAETMIASQMKRTRLLPEYVGMAYESFYGKVLDSRSVKTSNIRRDHGVYFTPPSLVDLLTDCTLLPILETVRSYSQLRLIRIADPAAGAGFFLLASLRRLIRRLHDLRSAGLNLAKARRTLATTCLYGVDRDELATRVTKALLWLELSDESVRLSEFDRTIRCGDSLIDNLYKNALTANLLQVLKSTDFRVAPFDWNRSFSAVFPSKRASISNCEFDAVLSNPPWGKVKTDLKEFFLHVDKGVSDYQGTALRQYLFDGKADGEKRERWTQHKLAIKTYSELLRTCGLYHAQNSIGNNGSGDADLYKYFLERAHGLVKRGGRIGFVIPAAFARSASATELRRLYLRNGQIEHFLEFENRQRLFPIHGMFKFALMTYTKGAAPGIKCASFGNRNPAQVRTPEARRAASVQMSISFIQRVSPQYLSLPELRSKAEQRLFDKLHMRHPPLGLRGKESWNIGFRRELDMTNDSADFVPSPGTPFSADGAKQWSESYMPLFEGRMVQQFDFAAKEYIGGQGRRSLWRCLYFGDKRISPHYFVRRTAASSELPVRAGFCDITGHANERTVLAALIPNDCVCGNKVPTCVFDREDPRLHLLWIAIANSFVIDWIVRRRISTTLNFFHWQQVPFPRIDPGTNVGYRLIVDAAALSHIGPGSAEMNTWLSTIAGNSRVLSVRDRATIRARIDAEVALLFGISFEDYALILSDFPSMDRSQPTPWTVAAGTRSRSTITRDKALLEYARLTGQQPIMSCDKAGPCDLVERVLLAEANGAVAYVPSQLASSIRERIQVGKDRSMSARAEIRVVDL